MLFDQAVRRLPRLALFLVQSIVHSFGNALVSSWCDNSVLASLL